MLHVNCVSMSNMCALVLPRLLEKRKGVIVNVSSLTAQGFIATATCSYSSTKAYASMFSECLQRTYKDSGTDNKFILSVPESKYFLTIAKKSLTKIFKLKLSKLKLLRLFYTHH